MAVNPAVEGRTYRMPGTHRVTPEEIGRFARAVGASAAEHFSHESAERAGFADVVATPTFAVTLSQRAEAEFMRDPEAGVDFSRLVHGEEGFVRHAPIVAGDELVAETLVQRIRSAGGHDMVTLETRVSTSAGEPRATTKSVVVIRGEEAS